MAALASPYTATARSVRVNKLTTDLDVVRDAIDGTATDGATTDGAQHWDRNSLAFLAAHLIPAPNMLRVATGYFSIPGFAQLRPSLRGTTTHILIGFEEDARQKIQAGLIDEILTELRAWHFDRYALVRQLADDLGKDLRLVHARARDNDHAKVYIVDETAVIVGSANLSLGGLRHNHEAATALSDPAAICFWVREYERRWNAPDTVDITEPLRARLLAWLELATPWQVYLKAASVLLSAGQPEVPSRHYRPPTEYQMVVVRRVASQLTDPDVRGAMLVASTGLGKTIMATHVAFTLSRSDVINRVVVFCPATIKDEWAQRLDTARVNHTVLTIDALNHARGKVAFRVAEALADADERTLVIIDESHRFRNRFKGDPDSAGKIEREPFKHLRAATARTGCRVLLLTATPFATSVDNINNQLRLLPRTSPHDHPEEGMLRLYDRYPWSIRQIEGLLRLEVATVLNTPFVARYFSRHDALKNADYLEYPKGGRRYFPAVHLSRIAVPLPAEDAVAAVLDRRILRHEYVHLRMYGEFRTGDDVIERLAATAWASSPPTLARTLRDAIDGKAKVIFKVPPREREAELAPVIRELDAIGYGADMKFQAARSIVAQALKERQKVVLFTERLETAGYLEAGLRDLAGDRLISAVSKQRHDWALKNDDDIQDAIRRFAPRSNALDEKTLPSDDYDVLIATDALAEGINLQDASYLISYDLAWTAVSIIQRAGRIMRLWEEPRTVHLYCFVPQGRLEPPPGAVSERHKLRSGLLQERLDRASVLTELPLLPEQDRLIQRLGILSNLELLETTHLERDIAFDPDLAATTEVLNDYAALQQHLVEAAAIDDDIHSARVVAGLSKPVLITLVRHRDRVVAIRHEVGAVHAEEIGTDALFDDLRCAPDEPLAFAEPQRVESARHETMEAWRKSKNVPRSEPVETVATILLMPREEPKEMLGGAIAGVG